MARSELRHQLGQMPALQSKAVKNVLRGSILGEDLVIADQAMKSVFHPVRTLSSGRSGFGSSGLSSPFGGGGGLLR